MKSLRFHTLISMRFTITTDNQEMKKNDNQEMKKKKKKKKKKGSIYMFQKTSAPDKK